MMNEIEKILLEHADRYPLMQAQDYVKLLYQMHMGPGHFVRNPEDAVNRLRAERKEGETGVRLEPIGNGLARCYLSGGEGHLSDDAIADAFVVTANTFMMQPEALRASLDILADLSAGGKLPCEVGSYKENYVASGMPMVSHSDVYREAYRPAYRVVYEDLIKEKLK